MNHSAKTHYRLRGETIEFWTPMLDLQKPNMAVEVTGIVKANSEHVELGSDKRELKDREEALDHLRARTKLKEQQGFKTIPEGVLIKQTLHNYLKSVLSDN